MDTSRVRATLENLFGILPGFAFYKGIGVLEAAATNDEPLTAGEVALRATPPASASPARPPAGGARPYGKRGSHVPSSRHAGG